MNELGILNEYMPHMLQNIGGILSIKNAQVYFIKNFQEGNFFAIVIHLKHIQ